jgi:hypothetical protein
MYAWMSWDLESLVRYPFENVIGYNIPFLGLLESFSI